MGLGWYDDNDPPRYHPPRPLKPWQYVVLGFATGFATCYLTLVPM